MEEASQVQQLGERTVRDWGVKMRVLIRGVDYFFKVVVEEGGLNLAHPCL
jgi:hypothetical protein